MESKVRIKIISPLVRIPDIEEMEVDLDMRVSQLRNLVMQRLPDPENISVVDKLS